MPQIIYLNMFKSILLVALGSGLGGVLRFLVSRMSAYLFSGGFPWGTFICNVLGCFLIGVFYALAEKNDVLSADTKLMLTVGLCGGFTTFSTFMNENAQLAKDNLPMLFLYAGGSLLVGFIMLHLGQIVVKSI